MDSKDRKKLILLEAISGERDFHQLYTRKTRYSNIHLPKSYVWVDKMKKQFLEDGITGLNSRGINVLTDKGIKLLKSLKKSK